MLAAFGIIAYTSRQAAQARENPNTHAAKTQRAAQEVVDMLSN
jgi:hypothetical protein